MTLDTLLKKYKFLHRVKRTKTVLKGREEETQMLIETLHKKRFKNSILIGEAGVGKTAIIEEFARLKANDIIVLEMNIASCLAGTRYRGDFEEKFGNCLDDIIEYNLYGGALPIVLFIDEIHTIIHAGDNEGAVSASNILKPYLSKLDITVIGATTNSEYEAFIKDDRAIKRRLSPIFIKELEQNSVIEILNEFCEGKLSEQMLQYIYQKSLKVEGGSNPDCSIEILDRCMAKKKATGQKITKGMVDKVVSYLNE